MVSLTDLITARAQRKRDLLEELRPLQQDAVTDEMRALAYLEALQRERAGAEQHLQRAEALSPDEKVEVPFTPPHEWPTAATLARELRGRITAIDAEITRVDL